MIIQSFYPSMVTCKPSNLLDRASVVPHSLEKNVVSDYFPAMPAISVPFTGNSSPLLNVAKELKEFYRFKPNPDYDVQDGISHIRNFSNTPAQMLKDIRNASGVPQDLFDQEVAKNLYETDPFCSVLNYVDESDVDKIVQSFLKAAYPEPLVRLFNTIEADENENDRLGLARKLTDSLIKKDVVVLEPFKANFTFDGALRASKEFLFKEVNATYFEDLQLKESRKKLARKEIEDIELLREERFCREHRKEAVKKNVDFLFSLYLEPSSIPREERVSGVLNTLKEVGVNAPGASAKNFSQYNAILTDTFRENYLKLNDKERVTTLKDFINNDFGDFIKNALKHLALDSLKGDSSLGMAESVKTMINKPLYQAYKELCLETENDRYSSYMLEDLETYFEIVEKAATKINNDVKEAYNLSHPGVIKQKESET